MTIIRCIVQKTILLVIVITATAIIAAATITTSIGAARPAFAKRNCNEDNTICSGGSGCGIQCNAGTSPSDIPGGAGRRETGGEEGTSFSGGSGRNTDKEVGGFGLHYSCDASGCTDPVGSGTNGIHPKYPNFF